MCKRILSAAAVALWAVAAQPACAQQMVFPGAEWETATPESQGISSLALQSAVDFLDSALSAGGGASELVIVRNGRVIWEGPNADRVHPTYSMTKSFSSTALGLLVDDGLMTVDTLAKDYLPSLAADYPDVALRHLATHTSGYRAAEEAYPLPQSYWPSDPFTPGDPLFAPGSRFHYSPFAAMDQMNNVLTRVAGETVQDLFQRRIGDAIGLDPAKWDWDDYETSDGLTVDGGGVGVNISARDAARLGHLFLNNGNWEGQQLISSQWAAEATSVQVPPSTPEHPYGWATGGSGSYGYGWWVNGIKANGARLYPGGTPQTFAALGGLANNIFVVPEWNMVIVREGSEPPNAPRGVSSNFLSRVAVSMNPGAGMMTLPAHSVHGAFDDRSDGAYDDYGDGSSNVSSQFRAVLGEYDSVQSDGMIRLVTKFHLPSGTGPRRVLEKAELRLFLEGIVGLPAGPASLLHSVSDNDEVLSGSDYEDAAYEDTLLDLVNPNDPAQAYYTLDVTDLVRADYAFDGDAPLARFDYRWTTRPLWKTINQGTTSSRCLGLTQTTPSWS